MLNGAAHLALDRKVWEKIIMKHKRLVLLVEYLCIKKINCCIIFIVHPYFICALWANSADDKLEGFFYFSEKRIFLTFPFEMKCQNLFSAKSKINMSICRLLNFSQHAKR